MATKIRGITIELGADTTQLTKAFKDISKELNTVDKSLKDVNKLLKLDPKNVELLGQKQEYLTKAIDLTQQKLEEEKKLLAEMPSADDGSMTEQQKALQELGIATSFTDNAQGTAGITYRVDELPTVVLISKRSTILYGGAPDIKLQNALETIKAEEEAAAKANRPKVYIKEAPTPAPAPAPEPSKDSEVPALREMPQF